MIAKTTSAPIFCIWIIMGQAINLQIVTSIFLPSSLLSKSNIIKAHNDFMKDDTTEKTSTCPNDVFSSICKKKNSTLPVVNRINGESHSDKDRSYMIINGGSQSKTKVTSNKNAQISQTPSRKSGSSNLLTSCFIIYSAMLYLFAKFTNIVGPYNNSLLYQDISVTIITSTLAYLFVKFCVTLYVMGIVESNLSRKLIHTLSGPLFMMFWPLFTNLWGARLFATGIILVQGILKLLLTGNVGKGLNRDFAGAISRTGDRKEALQGPLIYNIVLCTTMIINWRNLSSIVIMSTMAAGDGVADIIGRRFGRNNKWFFDDDKSIAGSVAFIVASSLCMIGLSTWYNFNGIVKISLDSVFVRKVLMISTLCAIVELIPFGYDDNWNVPISAAILSHVVNL